MIKKLSSPQKRILNNIISLGVLQGVNYILPLLTIPYLVRVLGLDIFGLLAFATAFIMYFLLISDYGFNLSATNQIAINKEDKSKINEIFCSVLIIKFTLVILGFILMISIVYLMPKLNNNMLLYIYTFGMVVGQAMIPLWLFQGMEKMKYMTYFNILAKLIATASIFIFVQEKSDYLLVPIFISLGFIVSGILSLFYALKIFDLKLYIPSKETLLIYLKDGWHIFINNIFVNLYSTTNMIILGFLTNNTVVGFYALAEKIIGAISGLFVPVTQAIYPYMASLYTKSEMSYLKLFTKMRLFIIIISTLFILIIFNFNSEIIKLISGDINNNVSSVLVIISISLLTSPLGTLFTQSFIIRKRTDSFLKVVKFTFLTNMILVFPMIYFYREQGLAYTVFITQIVHISLNIYFTSKLNNINKESN